jgi:BirA family biotin operon repressor/biotin-[acetyl-CoA-carboxylase] ligase
MSQIAPRPPLRESEVNEKISQYWRVSVVEVTGSTQEDIAEKISSEEIIDGDVVVAEFQSAGRGRLDRKFEAPQSSALTFSFYIEPERDKEEWSFLPLLTGMAAVFALQKIDPQVAVNLKWPNDLLISDLKVGGIISQLAGRGVIIGVGINVAMDESELPVPQATSLFLSGHRELNRNHLLAVFLNNFEEIYVRWNSGEDLRHLYREMCATFGRSIRAELPNGNYLEGVAVDISAQGELILADGLRVTVGDIVHLR